MTGDLGIPQVAAMLEGTGWVDPVLDNMKSALQDDRKQEQCESAAGALWYLSCVNGIVKAAVNAEDLVERVVCAFVSKLVSTFLKCNQRNLL